MQYLKTRPECCSYNASNVLSAGADRGGAACGLSIGETAVSVVSALWKQTALQPSWNERLRLTHPAASPDRGRPSGTTRSREFLGPAPGSGLSPFSPPHTSPRC